MTAIVEIPRERFRSLMSGVGQLSYAEQSDGWHFCCAWDGLLIHPTHVEFEACTCTLAVNIARMIEYSKQRAADLADMRSQS